MYSPIFSPTSGQDPSGGLDQHPAHVLRLQVGVVPGCVAGHVLELGERLDARVAAADEDERECPSALRTTDRRVADRRVADRGGKIEPTEHLVAKRDRLLDVLEPDRLFGQAGIGSVLATDPRATTTWS